MTIPATSSGAMMRKKQFAIAGETQHFEERSEQHRHRNYEHDLRRKLPQEHRNRRPHWGVIVADELAELKQLIRSQDHREDREAEAGRAGQLGEHIPVEDREPQQQRVPRSGGFYSRNPSPR
jgi:hypothetical protein